MLVVETSVFTRQICELLKDDELRRLQLALVLRPSRELTIYMLYVFSKISQEDLTPKQAKTLARLISEELK